jgi:hypothetical protein
MPPDINAVIGAINAPPAPFIPEEHHFTPGYVLLLTGFGPGPEHAALAAEIRQSLPPLFELVTPMPYLELQKLLDEANAWGVHAYEKGTYLAELSDPVIDVLTEHVPGKHSPMSVVLFYRLDGAYCRPGDDQTAFSGGRTPRYATFIVGLAPDAGLLDADRGWVRGFWEALRPHALGSGDGYVNGITDVSDDRLRHSYGPAKYQRLAAIKAKYEPWRKVILDYVARLVHFRTTQPALAVNDTEFLHIDFNDGKRVLAWKRGSPGQDAVVVVANFSDFATQNALGDPRAEYVVHNWPATPPGRHWREVTQDRDVHPDQVGREPIFSWEAKVYTTA